MDTISKDVSKLLASLKQAQACDDGDGAVTAIGQLEKLIEMNQHLLNTLGVGHPALDTVCAITKCSGLAAKLTGAGGGGCAFVLIRPDVPESLVASVSTELMSKGFDVFETTVGMQGVAVDLMSAAADVRRISVSSFRADGSMQTALSAAEEKRMHGTSHFRAFASVSAGLSAKGSSTMHVEVTSAERKRMQGTTVFRAFAPLPSGPQEARPTSAKPSWWG
jgi:hypothetical protein